ncbi:MAG: hypothetical protein HKL85_03390, partial [Acidimicrobiaceae bacterium]|nr:hypothetical protein [Acidimicrobiaceae bacterium]
MHYASQRTAYGADVHMLDGQRAQGGVSLPSSIEVSQDALKWVDDAYQHGIAIRVLEAETGEGKTYVAQSLYDQLAQRVAAAKMPELESSESSNCGYWRPGLAPSWPQTAPTRVEQDRKTVIPSLALRNPIEDSPMGFAWIGLPLGEVAASGRVDVAGQLLEQLAVLQEHSVAMHEAKVRHNAKMGATSKTVVGATKLGVGLIPWAGLAFGGEEVVRDLVGQWRRGLADPSEARRSTARRAITDALGEIRDLALKFGEPLIIVLDDAHAVRSDVLELLGLLTGLTVPSLTDEQDEIATGGFAADDESSDEATIESDWYGDDASGWEPPDHRVPILIVATTWPGESRVRTGGLFDEWLLAAQAALADRPGAVTTIRLQPIPRSAAIAMLSESGVASEFVEEMVDHLGEVRHGKAVNALVLADGRAAVDADLHGGTFSAGLTRERISALPNTPTYHLEQRLEWLREAEPRGKDAYGLLQQLAEWGSAVPLSAATRLAALPKPALDVNALLALLAQRRMIELPDPDAPIALLGIQVDLQAYIAEKNKSEDPIRSVAIGVRDDAIDLIRNEYDDGRPMVPLTDLQRIVYRAQELSPVTSSGSTDMHNVREALSWAVRLPRDRDATSQIDQLIFLELAAESGRSRFAGWAACQLAKFVLPEQALELLLPLTSFYPPAALTAADLYPDRQDKIRVLERAGDDPRVALRLAKMNSARKDKIRVLERAGDDPGVAIQLAELYPDRQDQIRVLERADDDPGVAIQLAQLYPDREDRLRVLKRAGNGTAALRLIEKYEVLHDSFRVQDRVANNPHVVMQIAKLYPELEDQIRVLAPFADNEVVALRLAKIYPDREDQIRVLEPLAHKTSVALRLAELYDDREDQIRVLEPLAHKTSVALRLSKLYNDREDQIR